MIIWQIIGPVVDIRSGDRIAMRRVENLKRGLVTKQTGGVFINALGEPVDDVGSLLRNIRCWEFPAPDIICRVSLHEPFTTDIRSIIPVPVGNGTSHLLLGLVGHSFGSNTSPQCLGLNWHPQVEVALHGTTAKMSDLSSMSDPHPRSGRIAKDYAKSHSKWSEVLQRVGGTGGYNWRLLEDDGSLLLMAQHLGPNHKTTSRAICA